MHGTAPYFSDSDVAELSQWRQYMHRHPEVSGQEVETARRVRDELVKLKPDQIIDGLGGQGVAAVFGGAKTDPTVMLRCELDALPIQELNDLPYVSETPGKGHLCGHDGHMAVIVATARWLSRNRPAKGRAVLLFQPAEEDGSGAAKVIADPKFQTISPDYALSLHNYPGITLGHVVISPGPANCASRGMKIKLQGRTAHASLPETRISPHRSLLDLIPALVALSNGSDVADSNFTLVTLTHTKMGEPAFGIAPGDAELWVTLRTQTDAGMASLVSKAEDLVKQSTKQNNLSYEISYHDVFDHCENHPDAADIIINAAKAEGLTRAVAPLPMRGSEDFGRFGKTAKSAMFLLGSGKDCPALHNPNFDFPDVLIPVGARVFIRALRELLY